MTYIPSRFNFTYRRKENENVIYNTFSKALLILNEKEYIQYETLSFTDPELKEQLKENGVLLEDSFDEMGFLKYFHYKTKFSNETLYLTVAPTLDCNFACPYCYENRRKGRMSPDVQDAIITFIEDAAKRGTKVIDLSWYGGEPLLYPDIIEDLGRRILVAAKKNSCSIRSHMVTNGYLLTPKIVELLDEIGVTKVQITLDGLKEHHDVRRPLCSGKGTFDRILSNLSLFEAFPIEVAVRMNVDRQNCGDFASLKKLIDGLGNPNITLYPSPVEDINKDTVNEVSDFMSAEEFDNFTLKVCEEGGLSSEDFSVMDDRFCFCTAETENCYVIDEQGDVFKCWDEAGRKEYRCFNLIDPDSMDYLAIAKYLASDPFADEACRECVFLPLCFGGCKFQRTHLNKSVCGFTDDILQQYIEKAFFSL
jgi:uncharacterized protein